MKKTGELHLRRMLAVLLTLVMLTTAFTVPALASGDWDQLSVFVSWNGGSSQAYAIPGSSEQAFWVQVDGSAISDGITISASHPSHGYIFSPAPDETVNVPGNAGSADGVSAITITAYDGESYADSYKLYVSTNAIPAVNVPVRYVDSDTQQTLNSASASVTPYTQASVSPDPGMVPSGYRLADGQGAVSVYVDASNTGSVEVVFYCVQDVQPVNVTVQYVDDASNAVLYSATVTCYPGDTSIYFEDGYLPQDYVYNGSREVVVRVDANGANPPVVEFRCTYVEPTPEPTEVPTPEPTAEPTPEPTAVPTPEPTAEPTPVPTEVPTEEPTEEPTQIPTEVPTDEPTSEPTAEPTEVPTEAPTEEPIATPEPLPAQAEVKVIYQSADGQQVFDTQTVLCIEGAANAITASSMSIPAGYVLIGADTVNVVVGANGTANPNPVIFSYEATERNVAVNYLYESNLVAQTVVHCTMGENAVSPDASLLPDGYVLVDRKPVTVIMAQDGTASPDPVVFRVKPQEVETPIPQGAMIERWGYTNDGGVNVRRGPSASSGRVMQIAKSNTMVYVLREEPGTEGGLWMRVLIDGQQYFISSKYITLMSGYESDAYMEDNYNSASVTPVPPMTLDGLGGEATEAPTDVPTDVPTEALTEAPTKVPTDAPTDVPTETPAAETDIPATNAPTATPTPVPYTGYALTTQQVALRTDISRDDGSIIATLAKNTLVRVSQPGYDADGTPWSVVTTLDDQLGMLPDSSLRRINDEEAKYYLDLWAESHATPTPTATPTASPVPDQVRGYAAAIGDGVPCRQFANSLSYIKGQLMKDDVVYVTGQDYSDGVIWHIVQYENAFAYVQADLLRMLTPEEERAYLAQAKKTPEPTLAIPEPTYNPNGLSSYGYISASSVNFRTGAGTKFARNSTYPTLKRYALCLVLGTQKVGNATWYHVRYGTTQAGEGYVSGDYFKHMTMTELATFLDSDQYRQGLTNNSTQQDSVAGTGTSGLPSYEDQARQENNWQSATFAPFEPFQTPGPLGTGTVSPQASPTTSPSEGPTISIEPLPTSEIGDGTQNKSGSAWGWVIAIILLLIAAGGVYVYLRMRDSKRKMAQRAAQRRAQAARGDNRPYARSNGAAPAQQPRTGTYPNQGTAQQARRPYTAPTGQNQQTPARPGMNQSGSASQSANPMARPSYGQSETNRPSQSPITRPSFTPNDAVSPYQNPTARPSFAQPETTSTTDAPVTRPSFAQPETTVTTPAAAAQEANRVVADTASTTEMPVAPTSASPSEPAKVSAADAPAEQKPAAETPIVQASDPEKTTEEAKPEAQKADMPVPAMPEKPAASTVTEPAHDASETQPAAKTQSEPAATEAPAEPKPRVGRRTAYRQARGDYDTPAPEAQKPEEQPNKDTTEDK